MIAAIIPAAGRSTRMGSPKALLPFRGSTFLEVVVGACRDLRLSPVIIVVGSGGSNTLPSSVLRDAEVIENSNVELGPIGSVAAGIGIINQSVDAAFVWPVDLPHVSQPTVRAISKAFRETRAAIVVPTFHGAGGHPVLLSRGVFAECVAAAERRGTLRDVLRADTSRVLRLPVTDEAVLQDIDTPQEYARLIGHEPKTI